MEINPKAHAAILKAVRGTAIGFDGVCLLDGTTPMNFKIGRFIKQEDGSYGFQYNPMYLGVDTEVSIGYIRPCLEALNTMHQAEMACEATFPRQQ